MRTDRELIAAIIARDETACQELYEIYSEELRQSLVRTLRDTAVADSIVLVLRRPWRSRRSARSLSGDGARFGRRKDGGGVFCTGELSAQWFGDGEYALCHSPR
jgi:hypothetical protein